jgi:hypothetical protein
MPAAALAEPTTRDRRFRLEVDRTGVVMRAGTGPLAEAHVAEDADRLVVNLWAEPGVPDDVRAHLLQEVFALPVVREHRPVLVALPRGESTVLEWVRDHLEGARSRVAGATCLVEGRVRGATPSSR